MPKMNFRSKAKSSTHSRQPQARPMVGSQEVFDDSYKRYIAHVITFPRLSRQREVELSRIIRKSRNRKNVQKAIKEFIEGNLLLVVKFAMDYYRSRGGFLRKMSISIMDLISEGNVGLIRAVKRYNADHKAHAKFSTFASSAIIRFMRRGVVDLAASIHIPANVQSYLPAIMDMPDEDSESLTVASIAKKLKISPSRAKAVLASKKIQNPVRLDELDSWGEFMPDASDIGSEINMRGLGKYFMEMMPQILRPREIEIVNMMYFSGDAPSLEDVGAKFGLTRERIRQILVGTMRKMRRRVVGDWESLRKITGDRMSIPHEQFNCMDKRSVRKRIELGKQAGDLDAYKRRDRAIISSLLG